MSNKSDPAQLGFFTSADARRPGERFDYPPAFDDLWTSYPNRGGHTNSKIAAFRFWQLRLKEGHSEADMLAGARRYRRLCDVSGKTGTPYVMQAQRFLGRDCHFLEDWTAPSGPPWVPNHWTPPPDTRAEAPAGYLTRLLDRVLRRTPK